MTDALVGPVERFIDELTPLLGVVTAALDKKLGDEELRHDIALEAFNLTAAFVDSDGLHTDDELWAMINAFAGRLDTELYKATPQDVRKAGLIAGKRDYLTGASVLFDILVGADRRNGTKHARVYYDRALAIAFTVASIDAHTSETELNAIERFRGMLLDAMAASPGPGAPGSPTAATAQPTDVTGPAVAPPEQDAPPRTLEDLMAELDGLVGLEGVKREVRLLTDLMRVEQLRRERGLTVLESSHHLVFTGNPGTGKTTVARVLAQIYRTLGVVARGHLVETERSQLVAGFVGQTAMKVRAVFDSAEQGVLLIDEAYALLRGSESDFGKEAIDTVVKLAEDRRDTVVVILAGYPEEMDALLDFNPGMRSRFPRHVHFPDYTDDELVRIFEFQGTKVPYTLDTEARAKVLDFFKSVPRARGFGNGRLARNLFEEALARQASRLVDVKDATDEQLNTLVAADIPGPGELPQ